MWGGVGNSQLRDGVSVGWQRPKEENDKKGGRAAAGLRVWLQWLNPRAYFYNDYFVLSHGPKTWALQDSPQKKLLSLKSSLKCTGLALLTFRSEELRVLAHHFLFSFPSGFF